MLKRSWPAYGISKPPFLKLASYALNIVPSSAAAAQLLSYYQMNSCRSAIIGGWVWYCGILPWGEESKFLRSFFFLRFLSSRHLS